MAPQVVPQGPWTTSMDWHLHGTREGETRTAFYQYVCPPRIQADQSAGGFPRFLQLPLELQQHIISCCDGATLFQLMQVSSTTRDEAEKLFWSDPTTRYQVQGWWLLAGGFSGHIHDDLEALARIQYIEVDFDLLSPILSLSWDDGDFSKYSRDLPSDYAEQEIVKFWTTLRHRFPRVTDVVLSDCGLSGFGHPAPGELTQLAEGSPDGISATVSCLQFEDKHVNRLSRHLWQRACYADNASTWESVDLAWTPRRVLPPLRQSSGPVGIHCRLVIDETRFVNLIYARALLLIQATEAYYLHDQQGICICPFEGCGQQFELPGEWAAHYVDVAHRGEPPPPPCERYRALFERHEAALELMTQKIEDRRASMRSAWGEEGSQKRSRAKQEFLQ